MEKLNLQHILHLSASKAKSDINTHFYHTFIANFFPWKHLKLFFSEIDEIKYNTTVRFFLQLVLLTIIEK